MTDRIVEIADTAAFLSLENHLLKIRLADQRRITVPLREMQCLILANPAITVTGALLAALAENGVAVIISDTKRMPAAMQLPLSGNYLQTERFHAQMNASLPLKKRLWQTVIKEKIFRQAQLLKELYQEDFMLTSLISQVGSGDPGNVESRAAVIYWKHLFPVPFIRDRDEKDSNVLLNYGYAILRAMTARVCCGAGLHPTIGINHHNRYDPYCLADDLMEPFRTVIDRCVRRLNPENEPVEELTADMRKALLQALLEEKRMKNEKQWELTDLLKISAEETARSFLSGTPELTYR